MIISPSKNKNLKEKGSVFFYILIAIFLFAALTYIMSEGNRTNVSVLDEEQAKVAAQEIIEYGDTVASAVQKLLLRGCEDLEISFENSAFSYWDYTNPNSPTDNSCHVFDQNGGAINFAYAPRIVQNLPPGPNPDLHGVHIYVQGNEWNGNGETCGNSSCGDTIMMTNYLNETICRTINTLLGYDDILFDTTYGGSAFVGDFGVGSTIADEVGGTEANGRQKACFVRGNGTHIYTQVLITR